MSDEGSLKNVICSDYLKCDMDCIHKTQHKQVSNCECEAPCYQILPINNKRKCKEN